MHAVRSRVGIIEKKEGTLGIQFHYYEADIFAEIIRPADKRIIALTFVAVAARLLSPSRDSNFKRVYYNQFRPRRTYHAGRNEIR